jgi:hypothetical protein
MDLHGQARAIGGSKLADGPTVTVWNEHATRIDVAFHERYLDEMESRFGRMDWAALAAGQGAYAVEKPWKYASEIAEMILAGELPDEIADYRCSACGTDFDSAIEANAHNCG